MLEDDLRNFPMATTGYLHKIRATQRYQDIIAAGELFKVIVRAVQAARTRFSATPYTDGFLKVDWLDCRLTLVVWDLTGCERSKVEWAELNYGIVTIDRGNKATLSHSRYRSALDTLVGRLRDMREYDCRGLSNEKYLDLTILSSASEHSRPNYAVEVWKLERPTTTTLSVTNKDDCIPPPTPELSSEEYLFNAIGKLSSISSSKQQPLPAVLDELVYRRETDDV